MTGHAPCGRCGAMAVVPLTGTHEPSGQGWWWDVAPGFRCPFCGEPWRYLHQPLVPSKEAEKGRAAQVGVRYEQ